MSMLSEFKTFAVQGNAVDMAVGIVIGAAFGKIITSLVGDVMMPPIGFVLGGINFSDLAYTLKAAIPASPGVEAVPAVVLAYGKFIQTVVDFIIIAFTIFLAIRGMNSLKKKPEEVEAASIAQTQDQILLTEIRDLLAKKQ